MMRSPRRAASVKVLGFSYRKRRIAARFLAEHTLAFIDDLRQVRAGDTVAVWAADPRHAVVRTMPDVKVLGLEDGFLRSVGLGAQLTQPLSWVIDARGIHFDPSSPSDIEHMLQHGEFDAALRARAQRLRMRMVAANISKYNVGDEDWSGLADRRRDGQSVVLVAGQVESDASIRAGAAGVRTNRALLEAARARHPDAWLIYKPHPDVVSGLRRAGRDEPVGPDGCDDVVTRAPITALLAVVDTVHVITSLTGFEALLRGKTVHCHGQPFYAGWGLTHDSLPLARRTRLLHIDELVAGALIMYPRYIDRTSHERCEVESALESLIAWKARDDGRLRWWHRLLKPALRHD